MPNPLIIQVTIPKGTLVIFKRNTNCPAIPNKQPAQIKFLFPYLGSILGSIAIPIMVAIFSAADKGITKLTSFKTY